MKSKYNRFANLSALAVVSFAFSGFAAAQALVGNNGVNMNSTGRILNAPVITSPNGTTLTWATTAALQGFMVPAGQLTGLTMAGTEVNWEDLLTLKSQSISVMAGAPGAAPTGVATFIDASGIDTNAINLLDPVTNSMVPLEVVNGSLNIGGAAVSASLSPSSVTSGNGLTLTDGVLSLNPSQILSSTNVTAGNGLTLSNGAISLDSSVLSNIYNTDGLLTSDRNIYKNGKRLSIVGSTTLAAGTDAYEEMLNFVIPPGVGRYPGQAKINVGGYASGNTQWANSYMNFRLVSSTEGHEEVTPLELSAQFGGSVGVNVHEPTANLEVNGSIRLRSGSPSAGKVLTSDANGYASWASPAVPDAQVLSLAGSSLSLSGGGGSVTLPADTSIYNADGTLTGNRTIATGTNTITILGGATIPLVVSSSGTSLLVDSTEAGGLVMPAAFLNSAMPVSGSTFIKYGRSLTTGDSADLGFQYAGPDDPANKVRIGFHNVSTPNIEFLRSGLVNIPGSFSLPGAGSPGAGKVLTSDASGNATWQDTATPAAQQLSLAGSSLSLSGGGGSVTLPADTSIYNADGSLTGQRNLYLAGNRFTIFGNTGLAPSTQGSSEVLNLMLPGGEGRYGQQAKIHLGGYAEGNPQFANSFMSFTLVNSVEGHIEKTAMTLNAFGDSGRVGIGHEVTTPRATLEVGGYDGIIVPAGASSQRNGEDLGKIRYNTDIGRGEMYVNDVNGDGTQGDPGWRAL